MTNCINIVKPKSRKGQHFINCRFQSTGKRDTQPSISPAGTILTFRWSRLLQIVKCCPCGTWIGWEILITAGYVTLHLRLIKYCPLRDILLYPLNIVQKAKQ